MLKLSFCLHRLPHLSREAFQRYWRETHGPLVLRHAHALGIERYVQLHTGHDDLGAALRASRGAPEPYDGVAELWWRDRAAFEAALGTPAARQAGAELLADEQRFIDLARSPLWLGEEHPIIGGSG
ncbi:MAG: EthD domain-containing protein [Myxococcota bacterium]